MSDYSPEGHSGIRQIISYMKESNVEKLFSIFFIDIRAPSCVFLTDIILIYASEMSIGKFVEIHQLKVFFSSVSSLLRLDCEDLLLVYLFRYFLCCNPFSF